MASSAVLFLWTLFLFQIIEQSFSSQKETFHQIQVQNNQYRIKRQADPDNTGVNATDTDGEEEDDYESYEDDDFDDDDSQPDEGQPPPGPPPPGAPPGPPGSGPPGPPRGRPPGRHGYMSPENRHHRHAGCWMWMIFPMKPIPKPPGGIPGGGDVPGGGGDTPEDGGDDGGEEYPDPDSEDYERLRRRRNQRKRVGKIRRQRKKKKKANANVAKDAA